MEVVTVLSSVNAYFTPKNETKQKMFATIETEQRNSKKKKIKRKSFKWNKRKIKSQLKSNW